MTPAVSHQHHWTDGPDDEEAWYCAGCGATEYPETAYPEAAAAAAAATRKLADPRLREAAMYMLGLIDVVYGTDNPDDVPEEAEYQRHRAVILAADDAVDDSSMFRYGEALGRGLSDSEAREEGWPAAPEATDD